MLTSMNNGNARSSAHLWHESMLDCLNMGELFNSREGGCREILGYARGVSRCDHVTAPLRAGFSPTYLGAELLWYLSGTSDTMMMLHYAPQYERWTEEDRTMHGALGPRLNHQLDDVLDLLKEKPTTRRCVLPIWNADDLCAVASGEELKNVPCYSSFQFLVRKKQLHMVTYMRSNDAWIGLAYDCPAFMILGCMIANTLGLDAGSYVHFAGSIHLYDRNLTAANAYATEFYYPKRVDEVGGYNVQENNWIKPHCDELRQLDVLNYALRFEEQVRTGSMSNIIAFDRLFKLHLDGGWGNKNGTRLGPLFDMMVLAVCGCFILSFDYGLAKRAAKTISNVSLRNSCYREIARKERTQSK